MATNLVHRSLPRTLGWASLLTRNISTSASLSAAQTRSPLSLINRLRPLVGAISAAVGRVAPARCLSTNATSSSLRDPNPNWSNRPPKETILLDGCDFEHWLVVMEPPEGEPTRDEVIDSYIKTLASVVGSEEEARMKIYSVSTRCYFAFGALVSEELSYKIKELPKVRWVLPDSYLDVKNKDYGGEPFINGQAVPYDPKYHEEWIRNNQRANERNRRNDRPRNFDRSRNFERRNVNTRGPPIPNSSMQNAAPNTAMPPNSPNMGGVPSNMGGVPPNMGGGPPNMGGGPPNMGGGPPNMGGGPPNMGGGPPNMGGGPPNMGHSNMSPNNYNGMPPSSNNYGRPPPPNSYSGPPPQNSYGGLPPQNSYGGPPPQNSYGGPPPPNSYGGPPPQNSYGGQPRNNYGGMPPNNMGGAQPNMGGGSWPSNAPNEEFPNTNRS